MQLKHLNEFHFNYGDLTAATFRERARNLGYEIKETAGQVGGEIKFLAVGCDYMWVVYDDGSQVFNPTQTPDAPLRLGALMARRWIGSYDFVINGKPRYDFSSPLEAAPPKDEFKRIAAKHNLEYADYADPGIDLPNITVNGLKVFGMGHLQVPVLGVITPETSAKLVSLYTELYKIPPWQKK